MPLHTGPCEPWPFDPSCCTLPETVDPGLIERWSMVATRWLWMLSGRRLGPSCPITIRPCGRTCLEEAGVSIRWSALATAGPWVPYIDTRGRWRNASVCGCRSDCSCGELCEIRLDVPVHDIVEVQEDGLVLPPDAYRLDAGARLVRTDGGCWPSCQDMAAADGEPGTFSVTYRAGLPLDAMAIAAHSELACELVKACPESGDCGKCRLPGNVTRVARQGVTIDIDPTAIFQEGRTGLPLVDAWLAAVNPYRQPSPSRVYSPDAPNRGRVTVWP